MIWLQFFLVVDQARLMQDAYDGGGATHSSLLNMAIRCMFFHTHPSILQLKCGNIAAFLTDSTQELRGPDTVGCTDLEVWLTELHR